jgi:predicted enzyme related to lactoylglutathione lyase
VVESAENTPYGRLAVIADPTGVPFAIMGPDPTA